MGRALPAARRCAFYPYVLHPPARASGEVGPARRWVSRLRAGEVPPFSRLAVVHGLSSAGDAMVAIALAGSIFFNVSVKAAQSRVALSLALTVAPFAIVGPLLGPVVERVRGGRRGSAPGSGAGRAACAFFMAMWANSLLLFPVSVLHARFLQALFGGEGSPRAVRGGAARGLGAGQFEVVRRRVRRRHGGRRRRRGPVQPVRGAVPAPLRHRRVLAVRLGSDTLALVAALDVRQARSEKAVRGPVGG